MEHPSSGDVMVFHAHPCAEQVESLSPDSADSGLVSQVPLPDAIPNESVQVPEYALGPLDASGHSAGLNLRMHSAPDGANAFLHDNQASLHSQLGYADDPESPDHPDAKLNHNPVDDVDIELTPSSIKRISNKYSRSL
ncbi:hypothetical protein Nepgr_027221 [Nepenthes gracilis]|uniref:Uncharacterized protein n=1 Tax=Nepenthes gracilis TaxID=150966 RepID=A0AAD3Y1A2_NEPGR|nr:hypothetical protein Nepgr_027221 [Nepenthes gracilis]